MEERWNWLAGGLALGLTCLLAVYLIKPIGVSTQYVILDGIIWNAVSGDLVKKDPAAPKGYSSPNPYLNKSGGKYAKNIANPLNYSFVFVLAMILGGIISSLSMPSKPTVSERVAPPVWQKRFGDDPIKRYLFAFLAGVLVLYGARLAGGCTSGHMISGMMQTSLSGYLFAAGVFASGIPLAISLFKDSYN